VPKGVRPGPVEDGMLLRQWRNRFWLGLGAALASLGAAACGSAPVGAQGPTASAAATTAAARPSAPTVAVPVASAGAETSLSLGDEGTGRLVAETPAEGKRAGLRSGGGPLSIELYMMSKCPFAAQVIPGLAEVSRSLGSRVSVSVDYIGTVSAKGELASMHGPSEVEADLAQECAGKVAPARQLAMLACQARAGYAQAEATAAACAAEAGIPTASLRSCLASGDGARLLAASFERSKAQGAKGSPTIVIGGTRYEGHRSANALLRFACAKLTPPTDICLRLPEPPAVSVVLLNDRRCTNCRPQALRASVQTRIDNPVFRELDYGEAEGRALLAASGAPSLPILVFDQSLDADSAALEALKPMLKGSPPARYLAGTTLGGWKPTCHDPGGCTRAECRDDLGCRREIPGRLDLFIMSHCPFAAKALLAMPEVLRTLGPSVDLSIHYIGSGDVQAGFSSMHGAAEVDEDARQLCAAKHFAARRAYLDYLVCRAADPSSAAWEACAKPTTSVDPNVIQTCVSGAEGPKLLAESFGLSHDLGIGSSPSWVVNNRYLHSGLEAAVIERFFCSHNPSLPQCRSLSAAQPPAPTAGTSATPSMGAAQCN